MQINFATQSYKSPSLPLSAQRLVNIWCEPQSPQSLAKAPAPLFGSPGLRAFTTCGAGPIRGLWLMNSTAYAISGTNFYSFTSAGAVTYLGGGFQIGSNPLSIADNGTQIQIVDGINGFIWDADTLTFSQIAAPAFYPCNTTQFFDGYFVNDRKGTNQFFLSDSFDGLAYDPLFFASAESSSDFVLAAVNNLQQLFIPGQLTTELWYDQGGTGFPLARYSGAAVERGFAGPFSWIKQDQAIFFLADNGKFYRLQGAYPIPISQPAIEAEWATYGDVTDANCFTITYLGRQWVFLTFPSVPKTWCVDVTNPQEILWHERESLDANNLSLGRWRANCYVRAYNEHLIGDAFTNQIGILDPETFTEYGNTMQGLAISPTLHADRKRVFPGTLELDIESGVGLTTGQGSDPQIMMRTSVDGGRSWKQPQLWRSMGKLGEYLHRCRWTKMAGGWRQLLIEITISDPVKRVILSAHMPLETD